MSEPMAPMSPSVELNWKDDSGNARTPDIEAEKTYGFLLPYNLDKFRLPISFP
jgi:hypothetical protein